MTTDNDKCPKCELTVVKAGPLRAPDMDEIPTLERPEEGG